MKLCPDCAEEVKNEARVCRYCGWSFHRVEVLLDAMEERWNGTAFDRDAYREILSDRQIVSDYLQTYSPLYRRESNTTTETYIPAPTPAASPTFGIGIFNLDGSE